MMVIMEEIYLELYDILLFRAATIVGNKEDAKDIVQDLYILIKTQDNIRDVSVNPRGYLYGMVTNMSKMFLRNQKRHRELEILAMSPNTSSSMISFSYIDDILFPLTKLQKDVVRLHDIEGYSCIEIALKIKRTPIAVKKQLALAHGKLKEKK